MKKFKINGGDEIEPIICFKTKQQMEWNVFWLCYSYFSKYFYKQRRKRIYYRLFYNNDDDGVMPTEEYNKLENVNGGNKKRKYQRR